MTRTVKFGTPSEEAQTIYNIVLEAETNAIEAIRAGVPLQDIDKIARDIISDAGYGDYFPHRLGHGLGLEGMNIKMFQVQIQTYLKREWLLR